MRDALRSLALFLLYGIAGGLLGTLLAAAAFWTLLPTATLSGGN